MKLFNMKNGRFYFCFLNFYINKKIFLIIRFQFNFIHLFKLYTYISEIFIIF